MKSMFRLTSLMVLAASTSPLAFAIEANAGATATTTAATTSALMQGCPATKNALELVREGIRAGHKGETNTMPTCQAFTMGFDEGKLHAEIRKTNAEKDKAAKAKLMDNPIFAKLEALKTSPRLVPGKDCIARPQPTTLTAGEGQTFGLRTSPRRDDDGKVVNPALPFCPPEKVTLPEKCPTVTKSYFNNHAGGALGVLKTSPRRDEHGNVIPAKCAPFKRTGDSWADRQSEKANAERAMGRSSGDSAADRASTSGNKGSTAGSKSSTGGSNKSTSTSNRSGTGGGGADSGRGSTNRDRQGSDGRGSSTSKSSSSDRKTGPQ